MLRIVHPPPGGNATDPPKRRHRRSPLLYLTPDEARHLRASIRNIGRTKYGTLRKLAAALGVDAHVLTRKRTPSPGLAVALWRLTGTPVEELLRGKLAAVSGGDP